MVPSRTACCTRRVRGLAERPSRESQDGTCRAGEVPDGEGQLVPIVRTSVANRPSVGSGATSRLPGAPPPNACARRTMSSGCKTHPLTRTTPAIRSAGDEPVNAAALVSAQGR